MKNTLIVIAALLIAASAPAQIESCPYDTLLNQDAQTLYQLLDRLDTVTLSPAIDSLVQHDGKIKPGLKNTAIYRLKAHADTLTRLFLKNRNSPQRCLQCSANKELTAYRIALLSLAEHLNNLPPDANSGFRYNDVMSAYHHLVSARSALMATVDATLRYHQVQHSIIESEKRVKRHVTIWGAATLGFVTILYLIHDDDDDKK